MATTFTKGRIYKLNPADLLSDPKQARKFMDANNLQELAASIRKHGVLEPILFRQEEESKLFIVAGERRTAAVKMIGLATIPSIYVDGDHREISLVENLLRVDLTPIEEAEAMEALMQEKGYSQYNLSDMIGRSQPAIAQIVSLNRLPADVKDQCRTNPNIPRSALLEVVKSKTEQRMRNAFQKMMARRAAAEAGTTKTGTIRLSKVASLIKQVNGLNERLVDLPVSEWQEEERQDFAITLRDIRRTTGDLLAAIDPGSVEAGEGEAGESESPPSKNLA